MPGKVSRKNSTPSIISTKSTWKVKPLAIPLHLKHSNCVQTIKMTKHFSHNVDISITLEVFILDPLFLHEPLFSYDYILQKVLFYPFYIVPKRKRQSAICQLLTLTFGNTSKIQFQLRNFVLASFIRAWFPVLSFSNVWDSFATTRRVYFEKKGIQVPSLFLKNLYYISV